MVVVVLPASHRNRSQATDRELAKQLQSAGFLAKPIHSSVSALALPAPVPGTLPPQAFATLCATTASSTRQATCPSPETAVLGAGKSMWFWIFLVRRTPSRPAPGPAARWPGQPECVARG